MQKRYNFNFVNPVAHQLLIEDFSENLHPEQKIKYLSQKGEIIPIMRGWYLVNPKPSNFSKLKAANLFYAPSYVSMHTALSYLGYISDKTYLIESVSAGRGKSIINKIGNFSYVKQHDLTFNLGVDLLQISQAIEIKIANPTKALYDLLVYKSNLTFSGKSDLLNYLEFDLRFDIDRLKELDLALLYKLVHLGKKTRQIKILIKLVESL